MGWFKTNWTFFKAGWSFLNKNLDLLWFALLSLICMAFILIWGNSLLKVVVYEKPWSAPLLIGITLLVVAYLSLHFIFLFFNAAMVSCILDRLQQQEGSKKNGLLKALKQSHHLLAWCVINAIAGIFLHFLESLHNVFAMIIESILGFSWVLGSYFVLPILIYKGVGPLQSMKESIRLFGKGYRLVFSFNMILFLPFIIVSGAVFHLAPSIPIYNLITYIMIGTVAGFFLLYQLSAVLNNILRSALFLHSFRKENTPNFDSTLLEQAISPYSVLS